MPIKPSCDIVLWFCKTLPFGEDDGTPFHTLAWKIPWTEEPGRLQSMGSLRVDMTERLYFHFSLSCIGEGNGNPLQCSGECLENSRDGWAWWASVCGVAQSWIQLKWLSSSIEKYLTWSSFLKICGIRKKDAVGNQRSWKEHQLGK